MIRHAIDLVRKHLPSSSSATDPVPHATHLPTPHRRSYAPLDAVAPFLAIGFAASFVWDPLGLVRILTVSGLIGYGTNWLAITMLFRPRLRRPLLGHGLIPAQKERIADQLASTVSRNLINPEAIRERLASSGFFRTSLERFSGQAKELVGKEAFRSDVNRLILDQIRHAVSDDRFRRDIAEGLMEHLDDAVADSRLEKMALSVYKKTRAEQWNRIVDHAVLSLPELVEPQLIIVHDWLGTLTEDLALHSESIESLLIDSVYDMLTRLDLKSLMAENLRRYDEARLEHLIKDSTDESLRQIQSLGGVLGTVGGLVIWNPVIALPALGGVAALIWTTDTLISRLKG